jgi:hypothetical protein
VSWRRGEPRDQLANVQGATLGLPALLLGFSFALATGRFSDGVQLIVTEANDISTAWLRCHLLPEAERDAARNKLRAYVAQRGAFYDEQTQDEQDASLAASTRLQGEIWDLVASAARKTPELANALLPSFNDMFDVQSARAAAARRHLPRMLLTLLLACSTVSVASVGYGCGVTGKRNIVQTTALAFLISGTLWAIMDMDHPHKGLIRVGHQPILELQKSLEKSSPLMR